MCFFSPTAHLAPHNTHGEEAAWQREVCLSVVCKQGGNRVPPLPKSCRAKDCTREMVLLVEGCTRWLDLGNYV